MAIMTYILTVYGSSSGGTRMVRTPDDPNYAQYLEWFHFGNGSLQPSISRRMALLLSGASDGHVFKIFEQKLYSQLEMIDRHLENNKFLAGNEVSAADCMNMFSLSTMRGFCPLDLSPYQNILRWMKDIAARPAYQRALAKGDDGMEPMIGPTARKFTEFDALRSGLEKL